MNRIFTIILIATAIIVSIILLALIAGIVLELVTSDSSKVLDTGEVFFAVKLSLMTATISSITALFVSIPLAYLLSRYNFFGKTILDTLLDLPIVLSPIAVGAMLLIFFNTPVGKLINNHLGPFVFEVKGIILAQFIIVLGLSVRLLKTAFDGVDPEYENLARTLGYNRFQVFYRVVIPIAWRGVLAAFLLVWARAFREFGATLTLAGAMAFKTETIPVAIYLKFESTDIYSMLIFILILIAVSLTTIFAVRSVKVFRFIGM